MSDAEYFDLQVAHAPGEVRQALRSSNEDVRASAARYVGLRGLPGFREELRRLLADDPSIVVRCNCVASLCTSGGMVVHDALADVESALRDPQPGVRYAVLSCLPWTRESLHVFVDRTTDANKDVAEYAFTRIRQVAFKEGRGMLAYSVEHFVDHQLTGSICAGWTPALAERLRADKAPLGVMADFVQEVHTSLMGKRAAAMQPAEAPAVASRGPRL